MKPCENLIPVKLYPYTLSGSHDFFYFIGKDWTQKTFSVILFHVSQTNTYWNTHTFTNIPSASWVWWQNSRTLPDARPKKSKTTDFTINGTDLAQYSVNAVKPPAIKRHCAVGTYSLKMLNINDIKATWCKKNKKCGWQWTFLLGLKLRSLKFTHILICFPSNIWSNRINIVRIHGCLSDTYWRT